MLSLHPGPMATSLVEESDTRDMGPTAREEKAAIRALVTS